MVTVKRYIKGFRKPFLSKGWYRFVSSLFVAIVLLIVVHTFFFLQVEIVNDRSDLNLLAGDRVLVNRTSYGMRMPFQHRFGYQRWGECSPAVGDVVAFDFPDGSGRISLGRVTGLPNDTLWLEGTSDAFTVVPENTIGIEQVIVPEQCVIGQPTRISYSVDRQQPFYKKLRSKRLFVPIK